jgi:hypothetical protein
MWSYSILEELAVSIFKVQKMAPAGSSETLVSAHKTRWYHKPERILIIAKTAHILISLNMWAIIFFTLIHRN